MDLLAENIPVRRHLTDALSNAGLSLAGEEDQLAGAVKRIGERLGESPEVSGSPVTYTAYEQSITSDLNGLRSLAGSLAQSIRDNIASVKEQRSNSEETADLLALLEALLEGVESIERALEEVAEAKEIAGKKAALERARKAGQLALERGWDFAKQHSNVVGGVGIVAGAYSLFAWVGMPHDFATLIATAFVNKEQRAHIVEIVKAFSPSKGKKGDSE